MRELVLLIVPLCQCDEDPEVVLSRCHLDTRTRELCGELIKASRRDTLLGTIDDECRDGRVVGGLLCEI